MSKSRCALERLCVTRASTGQLINIFCPAPRAALHPSITLPFWALMSMPFYCEGGRYPRAHCRGGHRIVDVTRYTPRAPDRSLDIYNWGHSEESIACFVCQIFSRILLCFICLTEDKMSTSTFYVAMHNYERKYWVEVELKNCGWLLFSPSFV